MIIDWNTSKIITDIERMYWRGSDPRTTGFETWPIKQDLYKIKWAVDRALAKMPQYADEDEFLAEHEKEVMWEKLKK